MKIYDNIFDARRHIKRDDPESFTWRGVESTGLAEVMEEAEKHGYAYKLHCYDETFEISLVPGLKGTEHHVREMIFQKKLTPISPDESDLENVRQWAEEMNT